MPVQFINGVEAVCCPCCKGRGYLTVWNESSFTNNATSEHVCTHCMGKRYIAVERPKPAPLRFFGEVPL